MKFENCKYNHLDLADRFLQMAEKFMPYAKQESNRLQMIATHVYGNHVCGTTACHGGFAGLCLGMKENESFTVGALMLANFLGFSDDYELESWAARNQSIWGNNSGVFMFSSSSAFNVEYHEEAMLHHIVAHYLSVAKRLMELKS